MSVENVPVVVNIKTLKGRFTAHKFSTGWAPHWAVGVMKSGKEEECCWPVTKFAVKYKAEMYCWTQKLKREDYGVDTYWVILAVVKE
jgi:hypothetical protein